MGSLTRLDTVLLTGSLGAGHRGHPHARGARGAADHQAAGVTTRSCRPRRTALAAALAGVGAVAAGVCVCMRRARCGAVGRAHACAWALASTGGRGARGRGAPWSAGRVRAQGLWVHGAHQRQVRGQAGARQEPPDQALRGAATSAGSPPHGGHVCAAGRCIHGRPLGAEVGQRGECCDRGAGPRPQLPRLWQTQALSDASAYSRFQANAYLQMPAMRAAYHAPA